MEITQSPILVVWGLGCWVRGGGDLTRLCHRWPAAGSEDRKINQDVSVNLCEFAGL